MGVFEDLTPYIYFPTEDRSDHLINVGWLGRGSRFEQGEPGPGLVDALLTLIALQPVNVTRGFHRCELCTAPVAPDPLEPLVVPFEAAERGEVLLGNAEVHVPGPEAITYAAPTLVAHYVERHGYPPPVEFTDSVLANARAADHAWAEAKRSLPIGAAVRGEVVDRFLSGFTVLLVGFPDVKAFTPAASYRPRGTTVEPLEFPAPGTPIEAVVAEQSERGRRILLSVGSD